MNMKIALLTIFLLLFIAGCNIIPPNAPYEQVAEPQFSQPSGTYTEPIQVEIASETPDASIFYTIDGSIPQELQTWLDNLDELNSEIETNPACAEIFYTLNSTIVNDTNEWILQSQIGVGLGLLEPNDLTACQSFFESIPQGSVVDFGTMLASMEPDALNSCNKIFVYLDTMVSEDYAAWQSIINSQVPPASVQECSALFEEIDSQLATALSTILYVDSFFITETSTLRAIAYKEGMWASDVTTVDYTIDSSGGVINEPPTVDAGPDQSTDVETPIQLDGYVNDDGKPNNELSWEWTQFAGLGQATFTDPKQLDTTVSFSVAGTYVLRLTADDGAESNYDDMTVTVTQKPNEPPTVALTAPSDGATYEEGETITLTATAEDPDGTVDWVEFWADGAHLGTATSSPYSFNWEGAGVGIHSVTAKAYDNAGGFTVSDPISVSVTQVQNSPPQVEITSPNDGATLQPGTITIEADASDVDGTIANVEFFKDGSESLGTDTSSPYSVDWTNVGAGEYTLTAVATDNDDATTTSDPVTVTVESIVANDFPEVTLLQPENNSNYTEDDPVFMSANASDPDGSIDYVDFLVNGTINGSSSTEPYNYTWTAIPGSWKLTAKAYDDQGASTISNSVYILVNDNPDPVGPSCGDGICNGVETYQSCSQDCEAPSSGGGRRRSSSGGGSLPPLDDDDTDSSDSRRVVIVTSSTDSGTQELAGGNENNDPIDSGTEQGNQEFESFSDETSGGLGLWLYIIILAVVIAALIAFFVIKKRNEENNPGIPPASLKQCEEYIRKMKILGKTDMQIRTKMKAGGWTDKQLDYIFSKK